MLQKYTVSLEYIRLHLLQMRCCRCAASDERPSHWHDFSKISPNLVQLAFLEYDIGNPILSHDRNGN